MIKFSIKLSEAAGFKVTFAVPPAWFPLTAGWRDENVDSPESLDEGTIGTLELRCRTITYFIDNVNQKVDPLPSWLLNPIFPPDFSIIDLAI